MKQKAGKSECSNVAVYGSYALRSNTFVNRLAKWTSAGDVEIIAMSLPLKI